MNEKTVRLRDLCDFIGQQVDPGKCAEDEYVGLEHLASGRFTRIGAGKASDVTSGKYAFKAGDVLYSKLRPYLDKAVLVESSGICTTELLVLRAKAGVDPRFVVSVVHAPNFLEHAVAGTTGVQHPRTSWNHIGAFELPAFQPEEQTKLAKLFWKINDAITANEGVISAGSDLKRSAIRALFARGLRGEAQKETEIGLMPESWKVVSLGSLGRIGSGTTPDRQNTEYWGGGTIPWITSGMMYEREIVGAKDHVTRHALAHANLPLLQPGAVLIAIVGQGKTLGHCAILRVESTVSRHVGFVQPKSDLIISEFLVGYLESQYSFLRQLASGNGSTRAALTAAILRSIQVPLPSTLQEQQEIVAVLGVIDRKIELHRRKRAVLDALFSSFLHKLMTGEIGVDQIGLSALSSAVATDVAA